MKTQLLDLMEQRRTIYALGDKVSQTPDEITGVIEDAIKKSPTSFNNQTIRAAILFGKNSDMVWDIVEKRLKSEVPNAEAYKKTQEKIATFRAGFGTILYFIDTDVIAQNEKDFALYADNFRVWAEQGLGGAQQSVWTVLAENGIGASLQHYNPLIDTEIKNAFNIPGNWELRAQMPFGSIEAAAGDKDFMSDDDRFLVIK
ncbi:nitroreductase family protein [Dellaglioa sp. P0083]|uniref:nitroreductase family protein n=1 Tax=Dellaglioa kimchii TaxID=3344667 RepID=UPI0038D4783E